MSEAFVSISGSAILSRRPVVLLRSSAVAQGKGVIRAARIGCRLQRGSGLIREPLILIGKWEAPFLKALTRFGDDASASLPSQELF